MNSKLLYALYNSSSETFFTNKDGDCVWSSKKEAQLIRDNVPSGEDTLEVVAVSRIEE